MSSINKMIVPYVRNVKVKCYFKILMMTSFFDLEMDDNLT